MGSQGKISMSLEEGSKVLVHHLKMQIWSMETETNYNWIERHKKRSGDTARKLELCILGKRVKKECFDNKSKGDSSIVDSKLELII